MMEVIPQLDRLSFHRALAHKVILVDFWEPWCGPCRVQLPLLEEVARRVSGRARVAKVNVDDARELAAHFGVQSLPTLVLFKNGKVVRQFCGRQSVDALTAAIECATRPGKRKRASRSPDRRAHGPIP